MSATGTDPGALLAAVRISDVAWAVVIAAVVWAVGWLVIALVSRSRARPQEDVGFVPPSQPPLATPLGPAGQEEHIAGVLRWLCAETEADSATFVHLAPGGRERIVVEPRGLEPATVAELARAGREALMGTPAEPPSGTAVARWLGAGGSKVVLLKGVAPAGAQEPLRFARFAIEWAGATAREADPRGVEDRIRAVSGVSWAETDVRDPSEVRVMIAEGVDRQMVQEAVERVLVGTGSRVRWVEPATADRPPRARLLEVAVAGDGQVDAEVSLEWRGQELRGRGRASASPTGRYRAAADAVADALGPLLAGEAKVEGLYTHSHGDQDLVVVVVHLDGERLVGAVQARVSEPDASAARAVLDAVNRRLSVMAGGSGRI